ncbi:hypothetical protein F511_42197 [Dorcoceras hygrometricum]|uniref:Uncharacterized protein n=1 Tax=Dorcoceras hygrometricum TaxID=472368 RepID=A0A2Z7AND9_9LAMI|nr:hypothetical protein F511_42197 [Dorcoceras hygrometricum]
MTPYQLIKTTPQHPTAENRSLSKRPTAESKIISKRRSITSSAASRSLSPIDQQLNTLVNSNDLNKSLAIATAILRYNTSSQLCWVDQHATADHILVLTDLSQHNCIRSLQQLFPDLIKTSDSSDESESGSVGLLLLRHFVSYPFRRQRRSWKRIAETSPFSSLLA